MKKFQIFILSLVLSLLCSVLIYSQTDNNQPNKAPRIGVIFPNADEKTGIKDLIELNEGCAN